MYTFLLILLFFVPIFYAEQYQTELNKNQEIYLPRSAAASYLFDLPVRRNQNQLLNSIKDSSLLSISTDGSNQQQQQRGKRIYWEDLAFHAADYDYKVKRSNKF
ncbi:unnamed protein product [Adineta steineri]|uniref:Uncharacterized protein n=1 Tax=Adineta steineri TaxID=433720 RepID=A0A818ID72_9BILA|nr:unnamed protein product [Adineta steineri]CAF3521693.1 unnamed protein product [Adineta steineri]